MTAFRTYRDAETRRVRSFQLSARVLGTLVSAALVLGALAPDALAQAPTACTNGEAPEEFGPTDINAVTGNGGLTAAFNARGTLTVLKWPSPSFYDQLEYETTDRDAPRMGADANDGALLGLAWRGNDAGKGWKFSWLRSWATSQRFAGDNTDEIVTTHVDRDSGLRVTVRDVVADGTDALVRGVTVTRTKTSPARMVRVFSFANFNPVYSKTSGSATGDWCDDDGMDDGARYLEGPDAIVQTSAGVDESTGEDSSVALMMAFGSPSDGHAVGDDPATSAYNDSMDASLANNESTTNQSDAAVYDALTLGADRTASTRVIFVAHRTETKALSLLKAVRSRSLAEVRQAKARWWKQWLEGSPLPRNAPAAVRRLAKRSLITLRQVIDDRGLIVTSPATQSPMGLDWVRNGAYMNAALVASGHKALARRHNLRYNDLQINLEPSTTPRGNWATSFFADGVPGSSTPYEIDSTGLGIWTLWDQYDQTKDINYLSQVYDAIRRAADHLSGPCIGATTNLQCVANEEGDTTPTQTIVGAQAAWLGLNSAVEAATVAMDRFNHSSAKRDEWKERRDSLKTAIKNNLYDEDCKCYTRDPSIGGTLLWPVKLLARGSADSDRQAAMNWRAIAKAMSGEVRQGGMEGRALLGNAHAWAGRPRKLERIERALKWMATKRVTRGTGLLGGAWRVRKGGAVDIMRSQPHAWHHSMFYLAALKTYGGSSYRF